MGPTIYYWRFLEVSGFAIALTFGIWAGATRVVRQPWFTYPTWGFVHAFFSGFINALTCVAMGIYAGFDELLIGGNKDAWLYMVGAMSIFAASASIATPNAVASSTPAPDPSYPDDELTRANRINFSLQIVAIAVPTIVSIVLAGLSKP